MRTTLFTGLGLALAGAAAVLLSSWLGLELEGAALLGLGLGAVVALVPDQGPGLRAGGFLAGVVFAWLGYFARAALLPDSAGGRAVALVLVVGLCVLLVAVTVGKVSLWMPLTGVAGMVGVYEAAYSAAPSQVVSTSMTAVTTILLTAAVGLVAGALMAPNASSGPVRHRAPRDQPTDDNTRLDALMEDAR